MRTYFKPSLLAIILIIGFLSTGCSSFQPIEVGKPQDFQLHAVNSDKSEASVYLPIKNPNMVGVKVTKIVATAYINDDKTGTFTNTETFRIPAKSDKTHELKFEVDFTDIIKGGMSLFKILRDGSIDVKIEGTITAKALFTKKTIDFSNQKTIQLNQ